MRIAFLIGTNDVGGAEYVSYHHVMMAFRNGFDMIVISGSTGNFYSKMKSAGVPIVLVGLNPDEKTLAPLILTCDIVFSCNFFGCLQATIELKKRIGFKYLWILHSDIQWICDQVNKYNTYVDGYYAIHQKIVNACVKKGIVSENKFTVIPNCIDVDAIDSELIRRTDVRKTLGYKDSDFVIGMITRIAADKNVMDAIKILMQLPESMSARLLIIGGPSALPASQDYYVRMKKFIKKAKNGSFEKRITITGNMESEGVYRTMKAFDIGLNCSPSEGLPIALLEMMAAGIVCIMPSVGDISDVLTGRGIVIPIRQRILGREIYDNPCYSIREICLFVNAIKLIHKNKNERKRLGSIAREYVFDCRSMQFQEKLFLKFLDMGEAKKAEVSRRQQKAEVGLPKMSVLMPTRDGNVQWIDQAIESIFNQDYTGMIELVVVNHDCRLSMTEEIDRILFDKIKSSNITVRHELIKDVNITFSEALDIGVGICSGEIIVRMDHDDIAEPELISKVVGYLKEHPDIDVVGVQLHFFQGKEMVTHHPSVINKQVAARMPNWWFVNHPGVAMRKKALLEVGGYGHTKQGFAEDYHLWCKFLKSGRVIANLPDVLMLYRCYHKDRIRPEGYIEFLEREKKELCR